MRLLTELVSVLGFLAGIVLFVSALTTPGSFNLSQASAAQATQVYTQAILYAVEALVAILLGIYLQNASNRG